MILKWHQAGYVFPAHAGMIPGANIRGAHAHRVPRTRGDDPNGGNWYPVANRCSPHTRG